MKNKNDILKKYIINKYGSILKFLKKEKISPYYLETVLQKNDIFYEISIGVKVCSVLNIDANSLFCYEEILELPNNISQNTAENLTVDDIIKEKYLNLNPEERKKVFDYANYIFENGINDL